MIPEQKLRQLQDLIKRSELSTTQKFFWLEKLTLLPEVLLDQLQRVLTRIEILQMEKKVVSTINSLPIEKRLNPDVQQKALLKLREVEQRKADLRKASKIAEELTI